jgi:hypothetical protein
MILRTVTATVLGIQSRLLGEDAALSDFDQRNPTARECINQFCSIELTEGLVQKYRVDVPLNSTLESCGIDGNCTITIEVVLDGIGWIGVGFSNDGEMIGSDAVM